MEAKVIREDGTILVGPKEDRITGCDILRFARLLIEEEGWNNTPTQALAASGTPFSPSSSQQGWTLHDAIGEAGNRALITEGGARTSAKGDVMWPGDTDMTIRKQAQELVNKNLPDGMTDYQFNDNAVNKQEILDFLDEVLQKECGQQ